MGLMKLTPWWKSPWFWLGYTAFIVLVCVMTAIFGNSFVLCFACALVYTIVLAPLASKAQLEADWEIKPSKWDKILKEQQ